MSIQFTVAFRWSQKKWQARLIAVLSVKHSPADSAEMGYWLCCNLSRNGPRLVTVNFVTGLIGSMSRSLVLASCRERPYWTLTRPSSTCSGWDGRSSWRQSTSSSSVSLPPAGFLRTDARSHHRSQDSPSRGAVTGHTRSLFTRTDQTRCRRQDTGVKELQ